VRPWKHVLVLVGALGVIGAFLPLIEVQRSGVTFAFSARELSFGMERAHKLIDRQLPALVEAHIPTSVREARSDIRTVAEATRFAMALFIFPALILGLGILGLYRGRVGRAIGAAAVVLGLACVVSWLVLRYGIDYGLAEAELKRTKVVLQVGADILFAGGLAAMFVGIGAIVRPDPPRRTKPPATWQPHTPPPA